jgi:hypothetical protein
MKNSIAISIDGVYLGDFDKKIPAPQFIEDNEDGVTFLFDDINELRQYKDSLPEDDESEASVLIGKINKELNKALSDHKIVLDSIKEYAKGLFQFIFTGEGHRNDRQHIFENVIAGIEESSNSWELEQAVKDSTFELGVFALNHKSRFMSFAHDHLVYNFDKIKEKLLSDLKELRLALVG